jgi:hypothetical protein
VDKLAASLPQGCGKVAKLFAFYRFPRSAKVGKRGAFLGILKARWRSPRDESGDSEDEPQEQEIGARVDAKNDDKDVAHVAALDAFVNDLRYEP